MLLILSSVATLYLFCFLWFRSQCRAAIRFHELTRKQIQSSNLIPFERGMKPRIQNTTQAV